MKVKTIIEHKLPSGKTLLSCIRCLAYLDENLSLDLDYYTARQYLKFMEVPPEKRCTHETLEPGSKEELIKKLDEINGHGDTYRIVVILKEIIRRLP